MRELTAFTYDLSKGADLLVVDATARPNVPIDALEEAVHAALDDVHAHGITEDELARATSLIETDFVAAMQSASDRADKLSLFATYFGNPALINEQVQRYRDVTAMDVTRFARERLGRDNRASLLFVPRADKVESAA